MFPVPNSPSFLPRQSGGIVLKFGAIITEISGSLA
jgi:hypothetical protein